MAKRSRLDAELVRRGHARSRGHAAEIIESGFVRVAGMVASKAATQIGTDQPIVVRTPSEEPTYVSRGAHKLVGALDAFGLAVRGRRALDAGASTGGFTDVLLRRGAAHVTAVDVGYGQLAWALRSDERVRVMERVNVRELAPEQIGEPRPDLVVGDLSFISLKLVLGALRDCTAPDADFAMMVKPQFEVGKARVGAGGVVREPALRAEAVSEVAAHALTLGLGVVGVTASPLPGPSGNVEYFLWMRAGAPPLDPAALERAIREGPA
ncbi:TlyA family rRNA (cytidine-2'-O)-methyltransferase [Nocardiopsis terrae]|uniref:23S rRNA (Cytidine1920-2'-O)/16S rRNA (Cytidine1409-2'-O)-methyltransferase n=1 Tax=Nocardiopsis terrae TaxID=372655 RepID=A0ABR9HEL0_9ACTN|nr:TlyA family RNA methyltransferase [Nocardiopsis terrae]MBE1457468.1 23S rRNA (cytidine1920-2'-O)/16S rRNA (cytidine1409-2'-O)-methyltransferase [Nocardiopsis terrae]GHC85987.1 TlyA family rRNA (cytidine-2'-O)-methyltransferase [Nocardiopsis terrae]